jgi:hypothetical protein
MCVIKIRGSKEEIIEELARFGEPESPFLNLRSVEVRRIHGPSNRIDSSSATGFRCWDLGPNSGSTAG